MKNKTIKNLIVIASFAVFILGANSAHAYGNYIPYGYNTTYSYSPYSYNTKYSDSYGINNVAYNPINTNSQYNSYVEQPVQQQYVYATPKEQQQVQYVAQPQQQIQYVSAQPQQQIKYVTTDNTSANNIANTQGASVVRSTTAKTTTTNTNTGLSKNTGQYVNYDANQNMLLSNAYGAYNGQQVVVQPIDGNGVTALTVAGSGSFMPSSVFQWFMLILLILAIIIVARMVSKTFNKNAHTVPAH